LNIKGNAIFYNYNIISPEGAEIILLREPHHTKEDIKIAKAKAKWEHDVVRFKIIDIARKNGKLVKCNRR